MQEPERYGALPEYAFPRLRRLLAGIEPGGPETPMSIGEPMHAVPPFIADALARDVSAYAKYPPNEGLPELREAISRWLGRRYGLGEALRDPARHILPLNGTREGLFNACLALSPEAKDGKRPVVLLPNPFYQCYAVAALTAGAEPVYVPATAGTGHLPDFEAVPWDILRRTTVVYICSPANPQGAVADRGYWQRLLTLAEAHDFKIFADECYAEIYRDDPPPGALAAMAEGGHDPERLVAFHSLSKRSNLAGLRSGFAASGETNIRAMLRLRSYAGAPMPIPAQRAAVEALDDEAHVEENRALYAQKYEAADRILGQTPDYDAPQAGFFLWLPVEDDEAAARRLWADAGVRALPGRYLSRESDGRLGGGDPGRGYLRVALVAPLDVVERGLTAVARYLTDSRGEVA